MRAKVFVPCNTCLVCLITNRCFVSTVGLDAAKLRVYIRNQAAEDKCYEQMKFGIMCPLVGIRCDGRQ